MGEGRGKRERGKRERGRMEKGWTSGILISLLMMLFLIPPKKVSAVDFTTVDRETYRLFQEQKWDSVVMIGKEALKEKIDYFYLRLRMGVSYYWMKKYLFAIEHLRKAREFNSSDPMATEYLYLSYIKSGRDGDAHALVPGMSSMQREQLQVKNFFIEKIQFESGYTFSSDRSPSNLSTLMGSDSVYGEQDLYGNNSYANLSVKFRIAKWLDLTLGYSYLNFSKTKYFQYGRTEDHFLGTKDTVWGKMYLWSFPYVIYDTSFKYQMKQHEFHAGATINLKKGFKIMPAFHYLHVSYPVITSSVNLEHVADTGYYTGYNNNYFLFPFTRTNYTYQQKDTTFNNFLASLKVSKEVGIFNIGVAGSWSNLNGKTQKQATFSVTYYPLGNFNFYGTTIATGLFQKSVSRLLLSQVMGVKVAEWCWAEGNFTYGDLTNGNIANGAIVYNSTDIIHYKAGASMTFLAGKHLQFSVIYQYFSKESLQTYYTKTVDPVTKETTLGSKIQNNPYHINTIIGGITWKF